MKCIKIPIVQLTKEILLFLRDRGLIALLEPTTEIKSSPYEDMDEEIYRTNQKYGSHKLLCVRKNVIDITLWAHSDNEDVIFLNPCPEKFKPLYLIIGLHNEQEFSRKALEGSLSCEDILALEVCYNDPNTCYFTILSKTPHCEVTVIGTKEAPIFYVTEPSNLDMYPVNVGSYSFSLENSLSRDECA